MVVLRGEISPYIFCFIKIKILPLDMIENILKQRGIKKVWLANQIGISQQLLNYYLRNGFPPKLEKLAKEKLN